MATNNEMDNGSSMLPMGSVLRGIYRIDDYLASGGFGNTYLATNQEFDEIVAIKEFFMKGVSQRNEDLSVSVSNSNNMIMFDKMLNTFKREAKRLRKLANSNNKHIVKVYDIFEENNTAYYVMQYINGKSLSTILKESKTPFNHEWIIDNLLPQMLDALKVIHDDNLWHLDIKPGNIMVDDKGNASLIDFGSSKQIDTSKDNPTLSSTLSFTMRYAPLELQQYDYKNIGPWTDLYSLGATIYNLATGQNPPTSYEILSKGLKAFVFKPGTRDDLKTLVMWMMNNNAEKRPQSVAEVYNYIKDGKQPEFLSTDSLDNKVEKALMTEDTILNETKQTDFTNLNNSHELEQERNIHEELTRTLPSSEINTGNVTIDKSKKNKNKKLIFIIIAVVAIIVAIRGTIVLVAMFKGGDSDVSSILGQMGQMGGGITMQESTDNNGQPVEFTQEEQELAQFSKQILGGAEDIWTQIFEAQGLGEYKNPKMVLYTGSTSTACGQGQAAMGPFYCSGDQSLYLDLSFFMSMKQQLGADGDFSYAYVIAHEVGHHVEYLTGVLQQIHSKMARYGQGSAQANKESVRIELLADYLAGCWAHYDNKRFGSVQDGDLEEAIDCAQKIGDDYLQKRAQGYAMPESFTHGTSQQRMRWFKAGYQTGDVKRGINSAMQLDYSQL